MLRTNCAERLRSLARKRAAFTPAGFNNIGDYHDGLYECSYVSPYSKAAHNIASPILIILQDWISGDVLAGPPIPEAVTLGRIPALPTNKNLDRSLANHFGLAIVETYATNLFPFVKPGNMSGSIPFGRLKEAAREFAIPQIEVLEPRLVIALGKNCFDALAAEAGHRVSKSVAEAIESPFSIGASRVWCQAHPGALGQMGRNRFQPGQSDLDWSAMADWFRAVGYDRTGV